MGFCGRRVDVLKPSGLASLGTTSRIQFFLLVEALQSDGGAGGHPLQIHTFSLWEHPFGGVRETGKCKSKRAERDLREIAVGTGVRLRRSATVSISELE